MKLNNKDMVIVVGGLMLLIGFYLTLLFPLMELFFKNPSIFIGILMILCGMFMFFIWGFILNETE